jgi:hypothetical protein
LGLYQTAVINFLNLPKNEINKKITTFKNLYLDKIKNDGVIWIICNTIYNQEEIFHSPFYIADKLRNLYLKNIIIIPNFEKNHAKSIFNNYINNILFLTKEEKYYFNKDPIREKHIWKNVEWGKREKNYNPKGKDPGNVWLKTKDDGKANILEHCPLSFQEAIERCYLVASKPKDSILFVNLKKQKSKKKITYVKI